MALRLTNVRLLVSDVDACLTFYRDVLGFPVRMAVEGGIYAELDAGGSVLALYRRDLMAAVVGTTEKPAPAESQDRVALTFEVENVDQTVRDLSGRGAQFVTEPTDRSEWYLRTAHLRDPEGNLIEIYHSLYQGST